MGESDLTIARDMLNLYVFQMALRGSYGFGK